MLIFTSTLEIFTYQEVWFTDKTYRLDQPAFFSRRQLKDYVLAFLLHYFGIKLVSDESSAYV